MSKETEKYFDGPTQWELLQESGQKWISEERNKAAKKEAERISKYEVIRTSRNRGLSDKDIGQVLGISGQAVRDTHKREIKRRSSRPL